MKDAEPKSQQGSWTGSKNRPVNSHDVGRDTMSRDYMCLISLLNFHQTPEVSPSAS